MKPMAEVFADMRQELRDSGKLHRNRIVIGENASDEMVVQIAREIGMTADELRKMQRGKEDGKAQAR